ncbi:hypothetical protein P8629_07310 [Hydrogenovibrio sp. 3SP14C1]|uniref:hypothetical protein n=1 Tax=Hydrogenovibrio sp. 3SP14C1 TaxID=3038774 RepID=UPI002415B4FE|nr:hypothetical protein [Hydrogenovibrio sp. 3SP14C1]MDG4812811.1 hypothetical protein [Hydrogenovibrio sp. 3SP14C1]
MRESDNAGQAVTFWLPELLIPLQSEEGSALIKPLSLPNLQTLLSKADVFSAKKSSFHQQASYLFHQPHSLPVASTMAANQIADYDPSAFWLRVEPLQMVPDRDTLVLIPPQDLAITEEESKALIDSFNAHFEQDRVQLEYGSSQDWYLRVAQPIDIQTVPLAQAAYQSVNELYPQGNAATYWHQMMNEVQMLFYTHPVNEARREKGWPEINSIWIWGEGQITSDMLQPRENAVIWSAHPYLQGMGQLTNASSFEVPKNYQAWTKLIDKKQNKHHLIHLEPPYQTLQNSTEQAWQDFLLELEEAWFSGLLNAVRQQEITSLFIDLGNQKRYHLTSKHMKRFWRFKKSLTKV